MIAFLSLASRLPELYRVANEKMVLGKVPFCRCLDTYRAIAIRECLALLKRNVLHGSSPKTRDVRLTF